MHKSDLQLKQDIEQELVSDPRVSAARIGVTVDQEAVTLFGAVESYAERWAAEDAVKRVGGVRTVAQDLTVALGAEHKRTDTELAVAVERALEWDVFVPDTVKATVREGTVCLMGKVQWNFEREAAAQAVRQLTGIVNLYNSIELLPAASANEVRAKVHEAKSASSGGEVTLSGHARSWQAIEDARIAAWSARRLVDRATGVQRELDR